MPRGKSIPSEQKTELRRKALELLDGGSTQKDAAEAVAVSVATLRKWLEGTEHAGKRRKAPTVSEDSPAMALARQHARLVEIDEQVAALEKERQELVEALRRGYDELGKALFPGDA